MIITQQLSTAWVLRKHVTVVKDACFSNVHVLYVKHVLFVTVPSDFLPQTVVPFVNSLTARNQFVCRKRRLVVEGLWVGRLPISLRLDPTQNITRKLN